MDLVSGFETYLTAYCSYQNKKESENEKHKKKQKRYELTPRYQRVRPKYGQRENKQALNEAHETLLPAGIALFGLTA